MKKILIAILLFLICGCDNAQIIKAKQAEVYYHYKTLNQYLSLTFDDGPDKIQTYKVLELLEKYNVKATFFVLGEEVEHQKEVLIDIIKKGHEIGNHFYKHENINKLTKEQIKESIVKNNELIESVIGYKPLVVRPPYGLVNEKLKEVCAELNMKIIIWTADKDSKDWAKTKDTIIIKNLLAKPCAGDIFLFHDGDKNYKSTLSSLDVIIPTLQEKNFKFVTITKLLSSNENKYIDMYNTENIKKAQSLDCAYIIK